MQGTSGCPLSFPLLDPRAPTGSSSDERQVLRAYCGVPIVSAAGRLLGTLCHYDAVPRDPAQLDVDLLAQVSIEIVQSGLFERRDPG